MDRLKTELDAVHQLDYAPYFLAVGQVVADIRSNGIGGCRMRFRRWQHDLPGPASATANLLQHRLLFERFLSVRRDGFPEIDLDVDSARRLGECLINGPVSLSVVTERGETTLTPT